ncbi:MAG: hypothetical protein J2P49_09475 [Methylocapsa sp.]|nr:hypothetical protein [Methylocapsa sp.]
MKSASLKAGLNASYARDVIKRGRGKLENVELVLSAIGGSIEYFRQGTRPKLNPTADRNGSLDKDSDRVTVLRTKILKHLVSAMKSVRDAPSPPSDETVLWLAEVALRQAFAGRHTSLY